MTSRPAVLAVLASFSFIFLFAYAGTPGAQEAPPETDAQHADVEELIATLENEEARQRLIAQLERLQEAAAPPETDASIDGVSDFLRDKQEALDELAANVVESWNRVPEFFVWLEREMTSPIRREIWVEVFLRLGAVFLVAWLVQSALRRFWPEPTAEQRFWPCIRRFARNLVLIGVYAATALTILYQFHYRPPIRLAGVDLVLAVIAVSVWRRLLEDLLRPFLLAHLAEIAALKLTAGLKSGGTLAFAGYFVFQALRRLGLPWSFHGFGLHLLFLAVAGILSIAVLRVREPVAESIRQSRAGDPPFLARLLPLGILAGIWHWVAIAVILAHYLTWALAFEGGFYFLIRASSVSIVVLILARLLSLYNDRLFDEGVPALDPGEELTPDIQERASRYANPLKLIIRWSIVIVMILVLAGVWRTGLNEWLWSESGRAVLATIVRLALIVALGVILTEGIALAAARFVGATDPDGQPKMSNRAKTLASIVKNVAIVLIIAVAVMLGLSEIGVDAAALLAGAGVIGLAIGFGSQRLVQDLINGLFILLGDTVRVGDVVEVAGKAGVVENTSMRTISLRSYDGNVHTVPYSSIDTITNMTKDFSYAVLDIGISYGSDLDLAFRELQAVDQAIRREWPYRRTIVAPLEIAGVDALADSAVMIKARIKTKPGEQWGIRREMIKRVKRRFDEVGIEIPFPHRTLFITQDKKRRQRHCQKAKLVRA